MILSAARIPAPGERALAMARTSRLPARILTITTLIAVAYVALGLDSWRYAFVGDEYAFYDAARGIVASHMLVNPLDPNGVYGMNPVLGSYYQALVMLVLGTTNFAWRFSNALLMIPISLFAYLWLKEYFDEHAAAMAVILLQSSFYLANYFKIGYPNPQAFAFMCASLYFAARCGKAPSRAAWLWLGAVLGLASYVHIGALLVFFGWPYLLPLARRRNLRWLFWRDLAPGAALYLVLLGLPLFSAGHAGAAFSAIAAPQFAGRILPNTFHAALAFYIDNAHDHFVGGPYLDLASRLLALSGIILSIALIRARAYRLLLLSYVSAVVVIGVTSPWSPPDSIEITRGIYLILFGAAFAGIALHAITCRRGSGVRLWAVGSLLAAIFAWNLYQSQAGIFTSYQPNQSQTILRLLQADKGATPARQVLLLLSAAKTFNYDVTFTMRHAYGLESVPYRALRAPRLSCAALANSDVVVLSDDPTEVQAVRALSCPLGSGIVVTVA